MNKRTPKKNAKSKSGYKHTYKKTTAEDTAENAAGKSLLSSALTAPYRWVLVGCAILAGWSLWTAGVFDGPIADTIRSSSVYADSAFELDTAAAQRVIGNRDLAVVFQDTTDSSVAAQTCKDLHRAADGVVVVIVYRDDDGLANYGCSLQPGYDDDNFGKSFVADSQIAAGISGFDTDPLNAVKVMAVQYDSLADAGIVPNQARVIQASAPRYLLAFIALGAVIVGAALIYFLSRRAGRAIADEVDDSISGHDELVSLNAILAGVAADILRMDGQLPASDDASVRLSDYRSLAADYAELATEVARAHGGTDRATIEGLQRRAHALSERAAAPA